MINKLKYLFLFSLVLTIFSCEDFDDVNTDPNEPTAVPPSNLLTQATYALYDQLHSRIQNGEWGLLMVQQWAQNEYTQEQRYEIDATQFNGSWTTYYASILNELAVAKSLINEDATIPAQRKANQLAIIDILRVQAIQALTETFGDIPYSQAINPDFSFPVYDSQQTVWTGIMGELDAALASMSGSDGFAAGDLVFGGDAAAWKKLGASILLKMAMRVSDVDAGLASQYAAKANGYGFLDSDALFVFDSSNPDISNPLWEDVNINGRDDFSITKRLINTLNDLGDPRLAAFVAPNVAGDFVGIDYGLDDVNAVLQKDNSSRPADAVRGASAPHAIMTVAEVQFFLAEAYERGILSGDAAAAYAAGVTASMNQWGISDQAAIDAYITANAYDSGNWKAVIGLQKWLALYMNGPEAWAEHRRLDEPALSAPDAAIITSIPTRVLYPSGEVSTNEEMLLQSGTADELTTKLWWDVN